MSKQGIDYALAVGIEFTHLSAGVAFGNNRQVDTSGNVGITVKVALSGLIIAATRLIGLTRLLIRGFTLPDIVIWYAIVTQLTNKDIARINHVGEASHDLAVEIG